MTSAYKTPGVYIVEKNTFPNAIVEVETSIPAFIGYTKIADNHGKSLNKKPWRITSLAEYIQYFGGEPDDRFDVVENTDATIASDVRVAGKGFLLKRQNGKAVSKRFYLYRCMQLFFQNGGSTCYIVSIGVYSDGGVEGKLLKEGVDLLLKEQEPTMLVISDAVALDENDCFAVQQYSLKHCGLKMKNRFSILDVYDGFNERKDTSGDCIAKFRDNIGTDFLSYSAAYYPWLNTSIVQISDLSFSNFVELEKLKSLLLDEFGGKSASQDVKEIVNQLGTADRDPKAPSYLSDDALHKTLMTISQSYIGLLHAIANKLNVLPPAAAMAGVFAMVDNSRGVWKSPANISLNSVTSPSFGEYFARRSRKTKCRLIR